MKLNNIQNKQEFFDLLFNELRTRLPKEQAEAVVEFADEFLKMMPLEEVRSRRLSDVYGAVVASWQFIQHLDPAEPKVTVFNPDLEVHGWSSTHTVIAILHPNMPFIMDSVRMALNRLELNVYSIQHSVLYLQRDDQGMLGQMLPRSGSPQRDLAEALIFVEISRHNDVNALVRIEDEISQVLSEVRVAVSDYDRMKELARSSVSQLKGPVKGIKAADLKEAREFLEWLSQDHFTFLGYDEYKVRKDGKALTFERVVKSRLGILRNESSEEERSLKLGDLPQRIRKRLERSEPIIFAKSATRSRVHRPAYPDFIAVREFDKDGNIIGERRFLGLYTANVYREPLSDIPLLRRKIQQVHDQSGFNNADYAGKELEQILSTYPRDELFQIDSAELLSNVMAILYIQERHKIRLFLREDVYGEFISAMVYVPREIYSTSLRQRITKILVAATNAVDEDFTTYFSESVLARTQLNLKVPVDGKRNLDVEDLESKIIAAAQSWTDGLNEALSEAYGEEQANSLAARFLGAFSASYQERFPPRRAAVDIEHLAQLSPERPISMSFYRSLEEAETSLHFKLFKLNSQVPLSDVLPLFENLGLRVLGEHPYQTHDREGGVTWIHDFSLESDDGSIIDIQTIREPFEALFHRVWSGDAENDGFNRLVVSGGMNWRQIAMFRAYARYMRQIRFSYSQAFISATIVGHADIARNLLALFEARFNPGQFSSDAQCEASQRKLEIEINESLEAVENLSEDRVLRRYVELIKATLRTNYYQRDDADCAKSYMSFKLNPHDIPEMPLPLPMFEIFVYSPKVEGVHLRGGKVARGGLRWSDRFEDYRTEVLGLVKAQQVKNSVIVPVGAKGGFVAKQLPDGSDREAFMAAGIDAYRTFIRGLLDITDNLSGGDVVPPRCVVRHDPDDTYLVVAADKGTATFSDIANELSAEYGFWLGDAFASGGSQGYDHKKMGITAKGAWVSVERHFREMGINTSQDDFTVVGIGDMSGDVFGNGMLLSKHIKLLAAFNHLHIFVDPDPDPAKSFKERERMFALPRSSWADYNEKLISKGGGIFSRQQKSITISPEMKKAFNIRQDRLPPNMLIVSILKSQVDLLWFGGIGTYVKASSENHADVGDKANDGLRVNGAELQAKVIGEGGNLGMTQLGRIEYSARGGRLNTDFIDNAGGVDCSDHEVNIKILLNDVVAAGDMTLKQRNTLLAQMTDAVSDLVLANNYKQTQALSLAVFDAPNRIEEYRRLVNYLESIGKLNRGLEFIPDDETVTERKSLKKGLYRPELCVLISYEKGLLKEELMNSEIVDDPSLSGELLTEFPDALVKKFGDTLNSHRLRREIIATQIANNMVNHMGITFADRLRQSTGAASPAIAQAYVIARDVYHMQDHWAAIENLDYQIPSDIQMNMMQALMRLIRRSTRWFLRNRRRELNVLENMDRFSKGIQTIAQNLNKLLCGEQLKEWQGKFDALRKDGVPDELAGMIAGCPYLYSALGIIEAQEQTGQSLDYVAETFFRLGEELDLHWFAYQLNAATPTTHWQALARESFREDLDWQQRAITVGLLGLGDKSCSIEQRLESWRGRHGELLTRWRAMLTELKATKDPEFPMYSVALRELLDIAQSTTHQLPHL